MSGARPEASLDELIRRGRVVVLATCSNAGRPATTVVSWLVARDGRRVVLALDRRGVAFENISQNPHVSIEVLGVDSTFALGGDATVIKECVDAAPFPCAAAVIDIQEVRDHALRAVELRPPNYSYGDGWARYRWTEERVIEELSALDARL